MGKSVTWNITMSIEGAPTVAYSEGSNSPVEVDAVDVVSVKAKPATVAGGVTTPVVTTAKIQPGNLDQIKFMYIRLQEANLQGKITYKFKDGASESAEVTLDKDHFLTSNAVIQLFAQAPKEISFKNTEAAEGNIDVVVARMAA
ncbi:hypothetical protein NTE_00494 [Candidatus Nitrososphaera evergladensis SR1]|uniref:Uncharacterized protein n=1 Tax=Candidatus Nitrososphaera evergladensis SR1 TaxID=1459636 RepID=A0A075MN49_9ARCH|nr:hypothetical protein [Candidatus Nitrososphaera evergladensis]AIF82575.1 hypothetical protein NTE_00494 [Candidatus Nitrososphaera evergladensis SR1]